MSLLITMLPFYLFGNIHCMGMCGPLVMVMGQFNNRYWYFFGRIISFTFVGMLCGEAGAVLNSFLNTYQIAAFASFFFGALMILIGMKHLFQFQWPQLNLLPFNPFKQKIQQFNRYFATLMMKDQPWPLFLVGFFTVALPCGQTIIVFSACALSNDMTTGFLNGLAFSVLTTPSLFLAMHTNGLLQKLKKNYNAIMGALAVIIGAFAWCRSLAEMGYISHWVINPNASSQFHIVIF